MTVISTKLPSFFSRLSLRSKISLSLAAILIPIITITVFLQISITSPLLEDEVRQVGLSVCKSIETDIVAFHLLGSPEKLESRLVEAAWMQPSILRLDVLELEGSTYKVRASSILEDTPVDFSGLSFSENPTVELRKDESRRYWEILYPVKIKKKVVAYIHTEVSLQLVNRVSAIFSKIAFAGAGIATILLILTLSRFLRAMIENERRLERAELQNVELSQQLDEAQRQLFLNEKLAIMGQLTASFAHEIGTPLNSLSGHLQLLKEEIKNKQSNDRIEIIDSQVSRIENIVRQFLASTHMPPQQKQLVDITQIIQKIVQLESPRFQGIQAQAIIQSAPEIKPIRMAPTDLEQVLLNLTNNAVDALKGSEGPRKITYETKLKKEGEKTYVIISVRDTGEGITTENIKNVLKPFFTTKAPGKGTGLGLTISQGLVKKYGGKLELDSTLGKGTLVTVQIPYETNA